MDIRVRKLIATVVIGVCTTAILTTVICWVEAWYWDMELGEDVEETVLAPRLSPQAHFFVTFVAVAAFVILRNVLFFSQRRKWGESSTSFAEVRILTWKVRMLMTFPFALALCAFELWDRQELHSPYTAHGMVFCYIFLVTLGVMFLSDNLLNRLAYGKWLVTWEKAGQPESSGVSASGEPQRDLVQKYLGESELEEPHKGKERGGRWQGGLALVAAGVCIALGMYLTQRPKHAIFWGFLWAGGGLMLEGIYCIFTDTRYSRIPGVTRVVFWIVALAGAVVSLVFMAKG